MHCTAPLTPLSKADQLFPSHAAIFVAVFAKLAPENDPAINILPCSSNATALIDPWSETTAKPASQASFPIAASENGELVKTHSRMENQRSERAPTFMRAA